MNLFEGKTKGTFVGLRMSDKTMDNIEKLIKKLKVPNPIDRKDMHTTLIYSRKELPEFKEEGKLKEVKLATPKNFDIFKSRQDGTNCLVVKLDAPDIVKRHKEIRKEHGATHDFDEYLPHITLSYDCGDFDFSKVDVKELLPEIEFSEEYQEPLQLDWNSKS